MKSEKKIEVHEKQKWDFSVEMYGDCKVVSVTGYMNKVPIFGVFSTNALPSVYCTFNVLKIGRIKLPLKDEEHFEKAGELIGELFGSSEAHKQFGVDFMRPSDG